MILTDQEIVDVFINSKLEEEYNFLTEDLVKFAHALILKAAPKIAKTERTECIKFVKSLNALVGEKLEEKRGGM